MQGRRYIRRRPLLGDERAELSKAKYRTRQQEALRFTRDHRPDFGPEEAKFLLDLNVSAPTVRWIARLPDPNPFFDPPRRMLHGLTIFILIGFYVAFFGGTIFGLGDTAQGICPTSPSVAFLGSIGALSLILGTMVGGIWMMSTPEPYFVLLGAKRVRQFAALSSEEQQKLWKTYFPDTLPKMASDWLRQIGENDLGRGYAVFAVGNLIAVTLIGIVSVQCLA